MRFVALLLIAGALSGAEFQGRPAVVMSNDRLEITVLRRGAALASVVLRNDPSKLNPLWTPEQRPDGGMGHFVCVDGFGPTSPEERKAGLEQHGEAMRTEFEVVGPLAIDGVTTLTLTTVLPLVQERFTRVYQLRPGEPVVYVRSRLESLVAFDRPIAWAEHATIGSPFLERGVTAVDQAGSQSLTRPYAAADKGQRSLAPGKEFAWPDAPLAGGGSVDLRKAPVSGEAVDHTTTRLDMAAPSAWVTAVNPKRGKLIGWIWNPSEYPWMQNWQSYPSTGVLARGLEFSMQPWGQPRRDSVAQNPMVGNPTFRWLPAKSAVETSFVLFYTAAPSGLEKVESVKWAGGQIEVNGGRVKIPASGSK